MRAASLEECMHGLLVHPPVRVHPCAALGCTAPLCPQGARQLLMTCLRIAYISVEAQCTAETDELPARFWCMLVYSRDDAGHGFVNFVAFEFAFPNSDGRPTEFFQLGDRAGVALDVAAKLCLPELGIALWSRRIAVRASVPEASVHKDGDLAPGKRDVRPAWSLLPLKAIAGKASGSQALAHEQFGFGVLPLVSLHGMAAVVAALGEGRKVFVA